MGFCEVKKLQNTIIDCNGSVLFHSTLCGTVKIEVNRVLLNPDDTNTKISSASITISLFTGDTVHIDYIDDEEFISKFLCRVVEYNKLDLPEFTAKVLKASLEPKILEKMICMAREDMIGKEAINHILSVTPDEAGCLIVTRYIGSYSIIRELLFRYPEVEKILKVES